MFNQKKDTTSRMHRWIKKERQHGREPSFEEFKAHYDEYFLHKELSVLLIPICFMGSISSSLVLIYTSAFLLINIVLKNPVNFIDQSSWILPLFTDLICCAYVIKNRSYKNERVVAYPGSSSKNAIEKIKLLKGKRDNCSNTITENEEQNSNSIF